MDERLSQAAELAEGGNLDAAHDIVLAIVETDKTHFDAWSALVELAQNDSERRNAIYKMWALRPDDPDANLLLAKLKAGSLPPLDDDEENFSSRKYKAKDGIQIEKKDYHTSAVLVSILYIFLWVIGLVFNIYFLIDANIQQKDIQTENVGCLWRALFVGAILPVGLSVFVILFFLIFPVSP